MDDRDRQLISLLRYHFPISPRPFEKIAIALGLSSAEVMLRMHRLRHENVLPPVRALIDARAAGYQTATVAMQVTNEDLARAARAVSEHPGIFRAETYRYPFNLWFVLSLPASADWEAHLERLTIMADAHDVLYLPNLGNYPVNLKDPGRGRGARKKDAKSKASSQDGERTPGLSETQMEVLRIFQDEIPVTDRPFERLGKSIDLAEDELMEEVRYLKKCGVLKRLSAVFCPEAIPAPEKVFILWRIPEEKQHALGNRLARHALVEHCCLRPAYPSMPFSVYTLLRPQAAKNPEETVRKIQREIGSWPNVSLVRTKGYKETPITYFSREVSLWLDRFGRDKGSERVAVA